MPFCEIAMDLTGRSGVKTANVVIPQDTGAAQEYIRLRTEEGEDIPWPGEEEAVISAKLARKCGIRVGGYRYTADRGWRKAKSEGGCSVSKLYL